MIEIRGRARGEVVLRVPAETLAGADLSHASLVGADLRGQVLSGACLWHANLMNADLSGADLCGANLLGAILWGAELTDVRYDADTLWPYEVPPPDAGLAEPDADSVAGALRGRTTDVIPARGSRP
jgi:hypothetical protein